MRARTRPAAVAVAALVLGLTSACTGGGDEGGGGAAGGGGSASPGTGGTVRVALDFTPNTNHIGLYLAQELGYYDEAGVEVEILPFAEVYPEVLVAEGSAEFGVSYQAGVAYSRAGGSDVVQVMAPVARNQYAISVPADRQDLDRPSALDGQTYAGFASPDEVPTLQYVIRADGGRGEFETVPLTIAAYDAVYGGQADFTISVLTWNAVQAELAGRPLRHFALEDYGFPEQYSTGLAASQAWLEGNAELARAFLGATRRGYEYAAEDPESAAELLVAADPDAFLDPDLVRESTRLLAEEDYWTDGSGEVLGTVDGERWEAYGSFLFDNGLLTGPDGEPLTEEPDWSQYWTGEYLPQPDRAGEGY